MQKGPESLLRPTWKPELRLASILVGVRRVVPGSIWLMDRKKVFRKI